MARTSSDQRTSRFRRAVEMLSLAIAHILHGSPDAARTNLRASWNDLKDSAIGRIEHMATAAFVYAVDGNLPQAVHTLRIVNRELNRTEESLPPAIRQWVQDCCASAMEHLPYGKTIERMVTSVYAHCRSENYAEALYLLTQANDELRRVGHLVPPRIARSVPSAWNDVLEQLLEDTTTSTLAVVREFTARGGPYAAASSCAA